MILRFVQGNDLLSRLIVAHSKTCMPFAPSHVEAATPDGFYLGAHYSTGVEERKPGYDSATVGPELLLTLPATGAQDAAFYAFLRAHIGEPYDWNAIFGFLVPTHSHSPEHAICSALITLALRAKGCEWFPFPLTVPAHLIDPRDLLLMVGAKVRVPM